MHIQSHLLYNSLPTTKGATEALDAYGGIKVFLQSLDATTRSQATEFGVQLLHNHFEINEGELLVNFGPIATPIKYDETNSEFRSHLHPTSWAVKEGVAQPIEFTYFEANESPEVPGLDLVSGYSKALEAAGLTSTLGLSYFPAGSKSIGIECTEGRSNLILPFGAQGSIEAAPVAWTIGSAVPTVLQECRKAGGDHFDRTESADPTVLQECRKAGGDHFDRA